MKRTLLALLTLAACSALVAQPGPGGPRGGRGPDGPAGPRGGAMLQAGALPTTGIVTMLKNRADITEEQASKIAAIMETTREDVMNVLTPEQREKLDKLQERGQGIRERAQERDANRDEMRERQQERVQVVAEHMRMWRAAQLVDLTDEQKAKVREIQKATQEKAKALQDELKPKMDEIHKKAQDDLRALLTDEQKTKFDAKLQELKDAPAPPAGGPGAMMQQRGNRGDERPRPDRAAARGERGERGARRGAGQGQNAPPAP